MSVPGGQLGEKLGAKGPGFSLCNLSWVGKFWNVRRSLLVTYLGGTQGLFVHSFLASQSYSLSTMPTVTLIQIGQKSEGGKGEGRERRCCCC